MIYDREKLKEKEKIEKQKMDTKTWLDDQVKQKQEKKKEVVQIKH